MSEPAVTVPPPVSRGGSVGGEHPEQRCEVDAEQEDEETGSGWGRRRRSKGCHGKHRCISTYARTYVGTVRTRNLSWVAPRHLAESLFWDLDYVHVPLPLQLSHAASERERSLLLRHCGKEQEARTERNHSILTHASYLPRFGLTDGAMALKPACSVAHAVDCNNPLPASGTSRRGLRRRWAAIV